MLVSSHDSNKVSRLFSVLNIHYSIEILIDLINGPEERYITFSELTKKYEYGKVGYALKELIKLGLISKKLGEAKQPIGYQITEYGRWLTNSYLNFMRELDSN
jgi:DNA-binding HxlR family transcriptional regulator